MFLVADCITVDGDYRLGQGVIVHLDLNRPFASRDTLNCLLTLIGPQDQCLAHTAPFDIEDIDEAKVQRGAWALKNPQGLDAQYHAFILETLRKKGKVRISFLKWELDGPVRFQVTLGRVVVEGRTPQGEWWMGPYFIRTGATTDK